MKAQGICPVCGAAVGVKPGDVAVQHTRNRGGWSYGRTRCEGSGAVADVAVWIAREQASALDVVDSAERWRREAQAEHEARLAGIAARVAQADETLRGLARLAAKAGAR